MSAPRRLLPSTASLQALEALDRLGSATAAAQELHLS
ncbi:MAG: LysR family transcriptional regulator, partial [Roseovarius sp.]|nr:LysR family transcriptional regulator [Roseovarius sp.]